MAQKITYQLCPACGSGNISYSLQCVDHTVSYQSFDIWHCAKCSIRFTQNVPDADDIVPYYQSDAYISHSDSGKGLINKLYKLARRYTLGHKRHLLQDLTGIVSGNLLDIGCGTGAFLNEMKVAGWSVAGLEPDAGARAKASELYGISPQPAEDLFKLAKGVYDAITMWHVLEHVHELQAYMRQLKTLLSAKGRLFVAVPNYTSADAAHYGSLWAAYDVPRHLYHFSPDSIRMLAARNGFKVAAIKPMVLDAYYIAMLSEQYKNGKGNLAKAVCHGLKSTLSTWKNKERCSSLIYCLEAAV